MEKSAFIFNVNKCVGCMACVAGCSIENDTLPNMNWREVNSFNQLKHPDLPVFHFSLACNHCADAPCMKSCPTLAYTRDEKTGAVIHHAEACIGCKYCTWACPFDAPKYNKSKGVVEKCTFCIERIEDGRKPACTDACPVGALEYDVESEEIVNSVVPGFVNQNIRPSIKLIPLRESSTSLKISNMDPDTLPKEEFMDHNLPQGSKVELKKEWVLVPFTLILTSIVAWYGSHIQHNNGLNLLWFLGCGALAMGLSLLHLGKKFRSWRSILNIRRSWLSREILSFLLFMTFGTIELIFPSAVLAWIAIIFGIISLFSVDMVYQVLERKERMPVHSAMVLLTSLVLFSTMNEITFLIGFSITLKLGLYIYRKIFYLRSKTYTSIIYSIIRIGCLIFPVFFLGSGFSLGINIWQILAIILLGEIIDRAEFYYEARVSTPKNALYDLLKNKML